MDLKKTVLGLEMGSTRIKAVLLDETHTPIATGSFDWENKLVDGVWTYALDLVHTGVQTCFADLMSDVKAKYDVELTTAASIGFSAMMVQSMLQTEYPMLKTSLQTSFKSSMLSASLYFGSLSGKRLPISGSASAPKSESAAA